MCAAREPRSILLVEDSVEDVELTLAALAEGRVAAEVAVARDGQDGLDYLYRRGRHEWRHGGDPAVVLLDIKLPKIDGLQVLGRIKGDPLLRAIPVVMLTSSAEERDLVACYQLGANAYVVKPVGFPEFTASLRGVGMFWGVINHPPPPGAGHAGYVGHAGHAGHVGKDGPT